MFGGMPTAGAVSPAVIVIAVGVAIVWTVSLVRFDVREQRLPDWLTLPAGVLAIIVCCFAPVGSWGLIWPAAYLLTAVSGIGGGDIKLALPLGVAVAVAGGVLAVLLAILLSSLITVIALIATQRSGMAHGPSMLASAWIVVIACTIM